MDSTKVFDERFYNLIKEGVNPVQLEKDEQKDPPSLPIQPVNNASATILSCSFCNIQFLDVAQHREHYKLDWHRYNLKQNLSSKPPITEEEFNERTDDVSSISGSESDEEETLDTIATSQGKIFVKNNLGQIFGMYKCLLAGKKEEIDSNSILESLIEYHKNPLWAVFMLGGGHFAGAVFKNDEPILHKTFHCYTVRAGQGGSQSTRDSQSGGSHPKSAGASLRRYNEMALIQHVKDIVDIWKTEIDKCSLIICRAAGPYNKSVLFGGKTPLLNRTDPRVRTVPFSTRRATYTEVKRVHNILSTVLLYDSVEAVMKSFERQSSPDRAKRSKSNTATINRAKSREAIERKLPAEIDKEISKENEVRNALVKSKKGKKLEEINQDSESDDQEYAVEEVTVNFSDSLQPFEDTLTPAERKKKSSRAKEKIRKQREKQLQQDRRDEIFNAARIGDIDSLNKILSRENDDDSALISKHKMNELSTDTGDSLLHIAAKNCQTKMIYFLLDNDADLCARNDKQETPYTCTKDKDVREMFRKYASDNPDKCNYNKANIPTNSLSPEEISEKKRQQRKVKREKEKEKKKENEIKKKELQEKDRFLQLSDREKRALAAERRILNQSGVVITRCFLCAGDMSGKVPFEYLGNRFCSIECLKAHRMKNPIILSA